MLDSAVLFIEMRSMFYFIFLGTVVLVGVGLLSYTRHLILRRMFGKI